jgi:hypothetical protein
MWYVDCPTCGDAWGYTTIARATADRYHQQALAEMSSVRENLADLFPRPHKGKGDKQILKELGFD